MKFSQAIEEIKNRVDIVEVISEYLPLQKAGANYKVLCPFHKEKTPSFIVSGQKQLFKCFGCGIGGNVFTFLQKIERVSFKEAVFILAKRLGIEIKDESISSPKTEVLYKINQEAACVYQDLLFKDENKFALEYLIKRRNLNLDIIKKFKLGYAPYDFSLFNFLQQKGYKKEDIYEAGLFTQTKDIFKDRIIFPIFDIKNRIIGFGGRIIDDNNDKPKYINTSQTLIYNKGKNLYGLNLAKDYITKEGKAILVEGYLDVIVSHMYGLYNVIGVLGTSLTEDQAVLLKRYVNSVILVFDPDQAGKKATIRGLNILVEQGLEPKVALLPNGYDPASFLQEKNKEEFLSFLSQAQELTTYRLNEALSNHDKSTPAGKSCIIRDLLDIIKSIREPIKQHAFISKIANTIGLEENIVLKEVEFLLKGEEFIRPEIIGTKDRLFDEEHLLKVALENENIKEILISCIDNEDFQDENIKEIFLVMKNNPSLGVPELLNLLSEQARDVLSKLAIEKPKIKQTEKDLKEKFINLKIRRLKRERECLNKKMQEYEEEKIPFLQKELQEKKEEEEELKKININKLSLQELIKKIFK
jgi:DNA primase